MQRGAEAELLVRTLGDVEVRASGERAWVQPPPQQRTLLALLVVQLGAPVRADGAAEALWGDRAPPHARRLVQALVSRLRGVLEPAGARESRLRSVPGGWQLDLDPDAVDVTRFERLARSAADAAAGGDRNAARRALEEAVSLWRGRPFADLADHPGLVAATTRLEEGLLAARELLLELRIDAGEHTEAVAELQELVIAHPLRERAWGLLLEALYRSGRQSDALAAYQQVRQRLVDELGTEPGPQLQRLHAAILRHELPADSPAAAERLSSSRRQPVVSWPCRRDLPLVGRDRELAALQAALEHARDGRGQLVLLAGEAGVGKTRLVAEFAEAAADGVDVLAGRCAEGARVPYEPVVEALRADVEATPDERLSARLGRGAGELARLLPELADRTGHAPAPPALSPELDQHRLFDAVAGWLAAASAETPLIIVFEDLHAATRPTLLLLGHVAQVTATCPLLLIATYRDTGEELSPALAETIAQLTRRPDATQVQLVGLDQPAVAELLAVGHTDLAEEAGWAETLHAATAGNPLFVEELLAALAEERPAAPERLLDHRVPHGVRELLHTRIRRLSPATVRLLHHAAVAGDRFDFAGVTQAAELTEHDALDALDEAHAARLISATDTGEDAYRFTHALTRATLLDAITPSHRLRLHARLAATLESRHADDPRRVAGPLAHHYAAAGPAGDPAKTMVYTVAAGDTAMEQHAYDEAAASYEHALALLDAARDDVRRCELLTRLGEAQARAGQAEHQPTLVRATRLAIDLGDAERTAEAALAGSRGFFSHVGGVDDQRVVLLHDALEVVSSADPGPRAVLLALLGSELVFAADLSRRRALTDEALQLARQQPDPSVLGRVLALRQMTIQHPATLGERLGETGELIELARRLTDPLVETLAHMWRFLAVLEIGDRPEADAAVDHARRLADAELGHPVVEVFLGSMDAARELMWGDLDRAQRLAERYRELGRRAGVHDVDSPYLAHQFILHRERGTLLEYVPLLERAVDAYGMVPAWQAAAALVWWLTGQHERALGVLDRYAADDFASVPRDHLWTDALCLFAEVAALAGRRDAAQALIAHLDPYRDRLAAEPAVPLGAVAHYLGLAATSLEDWDAAQSYFHEAADLHDRIGADRWYARTLRAHAHMHRSRGAPGDRRTAERLWRHAADRARRPRSGARALDRSEHAAPVPGGSDGTVAPP